MSLTSPPDPSASWSIAHYTAFLAGVLLMLALGGCGSSGAGDAASPPSSSSESSSGDSGQQAQADPMALGIDTVQWPGDLAGAEAVFNQMPDQLAGMPAKPTGQFYGPAAGVHYGPGSTGLTAWAMGTDKQVKDPRAALGVMFGMGLVCVKGTGVGTAPVGRWGTPEIDSPGGSGLDDGLWWFSCDFESESDAYKGHAIGWVSGDLAWLVTTTDRSSTQVTVSALHDALG